MKSRTLFSLPNVAAHRAGSSGRDLSRRGLSGARRFELSRVPSRRRTARRGGQALLLAVVIMLLAAVLSATFLAVLSGNLNQTARIGDKTRAIEASRAGIAFANAQLSGSAGGDLWRPIDASPAPLPGDATYDLYYSQLDKIRGWANTTLPTDPNYRDRVYAKFPDPNQPIGNAPKFLVRVEELPTDSTVTGYEAEHAGEIKITSIGLSDDDPNAFHKTIAYKEGRKTSPFARALRSVSNWDFRNKTVPQGAVAIIARNAQTTDVTLQNVKGALPAAPFNVVMSHKDADPTLSATYGAVVTAVDLTTPDAPKLTLSGVAPTTFVPTDTLQLAAAIGTASTIDLINSGTAGAFPDQVQPNGILANGSTWLQGQIQLANLSKNGTKLYTSGALAIDGATAQKPVLAGGDVGPTVTTDTDSNKLVPSSNANFPGKISIEATAASNGVTPLDLIRDGWGRLNNKVLGLDYSLDTSTARGTDPNPNRRERDVQPFTPVDIASKQNLARYRKLTRDSNQGIYIGNRDDVERVGNTPMTQSQLIEMWLSPPNGAEDFTRNGTPTQPSPPTVPPAPPAPPVSLEQQHLRGWIGPDEFLARGALVELLQDAGGIPFIRLTMDARSDRNPAGLDADKAVRDGNGNVRPGVYSENLAWPADGVLFAEGNLRVRGTVNLSAVPAAMAARYPSLTIVSQNNIYVEGSVGVDAPFDPAATVAVNNAKKKLMLLARRNVVVNPTRSVVGHMDEQTISSNTADIPVTGTAPNQSIVVPVNDALPFKEGDVVETYDTTAGTLSVRGILTARDTTVAPNTLTLAVLTGTTVQPGSGVKTLLSDKLGTNTTATPNRKYFVADAADAINRRILLQNAAAAYPNLRLTLDHLAKRVLAVKVETEPSGADPVTGALFTKPDAPFNVFLSNKRVLDAAGVFDAHTSFVDGQNKLLRGQFDKPTTGTDTFPGAPPRPFADDATAKTFSLEDLKNAMVATTHEDAATQKGWKYKVTLDTAVPNTLPFFYLAGVGLRNDNFVPLVAPDAWRKDVGTEAYDIPLATSVRLQRNAINQNLTAAYTGIDNSSGMPVETPASYTVPYLGFNPAYGAVADPGNPNAFLEDLLSVDQSFYQLDADDNKSTFDSRKTDAPFASNDALLLRQNDDLLNSLGVTLPEYRVRSMKLENTDLSATNPTPIIQPIVLSINAYVYAQAGSWFVIPGDYFGTDARVRSDANGTASYIDYNGNKTPDVGEYAEGTNTGNVAGTFDAGDFADLNRNGVEDPGEAESVERLLRYNYRINFDGAIVENQTAIVADVPGAVATDPPLANGAVQNWMDKWAAYDSTIAGATKRDKFRFISYTYDPSVALGTAGANQLRVPVSDELIYQE